MNDPTMEQAAEEERPDQVLLQAEDGGPKQPKKKGRERGMSALVRVLLTLIIIALGIFLILYLVARAGRFDSIASMLQHMWVELSLMWQRISS